MNPNALVKSQEVLSKNSIEQLLAMRETEKALKSRLAVIEKAIEKSEKEIIQQIEAGADLSRCGYAISIQEVFRRYPAWKEHFIERLGKEEADNVISLTPVKVYKNLIIR